MSREEALRLGLKYVTPKLESGEFLIAAEEVRWLIVFKRVYQGLSYRKIKRHLSAGTIVVTDKKIGLTVARYKASGEVMPLRRRPNGQQLQPSIFTEARCHGAHFSSVSADTSVPT